MSESIRRLRAFATEIIKAAAKAVEIQDPDIRHLLSERRGEEYLQGGRLLANSAAEGAHYVIKLGGISSQPPGISHDLSSKTKKNNRYQKARDYSAAGLRGSLAGLGVLAGRNAMKGHFGTPVGTHAIRHASRAARHHAAGGAAISMLDRAYRHDELPYEKKAFVQPNPATAFKSPASSLAESRSTGGFKSTVVHKLGKPPKVVQLGKKFRIT